jgi:queuine tRNA-ribosyltransferase
MSFKLIKTSKHSQARVGELKTRRGFIKTPFFMPIATKGAVKNLSYEDLKALNAQIILSNTYHLMLRPGEKLVKRAGGLHEFISWNKPILTDSGGFQVFSLDQMRKITEKGVEFRSHIDGRKIFLSPEDSIRIQLDLRSDIIMVLDECVALPAKKKYLQDSVELTTRWARRCRDYLIKSRNQQIKKSTPPLVFGIVQGGLNKSLRLKSAKDLVEIGFDGYAIGGLSVGEPAKDRNRVLDYLSPILPKDQPRYLMGIGRPDDIIEAVKRGVDMFDCVVPTREARHGRLYLWNPRVKKVLNNPSACFKQVNVKAQKFQKDFSPINSQSKVKLLQAYSKAYLRHLFSVQEPLAQRLATLNNLEFYLELMRRIRDEV